MDEDKLAKNLLANRTCESCKHYDCWEHPHDGDEVRDCKINGPYRNKTCERWDRVSESMQVLLNRWEEVSKLDDIHIKQTKENIKKSIERISGEYEKFKKFI